MPPSTTITGPALYAALTIAGVLIALALFVLFFPRFSRRPLEFHFNPVGAVSPVTLLVTAVASLVTAYHLIAHALNVLPQFRMPLWVVIPGALIAVCASLAIDVMDNRDEQQSGD